MRRRIVVSWILAACGTAVSALLSGCRPERAEARTAGPLTLADPVVRAQGSSIWVVASWRLGPSDGLGAIDSVITTSGTDSGGAPQRHALAPAATRDSFSFARPQPGSSATGYVCAATKRRGLLSPTACKPWSYTAPDQAPPPPLLDTVRIVALRIWPDPATALAAATQQALRLPASRAQVQFCAFATMGDQSVVRDQKPFGHPGAAYCDSVGRALYGTRYARGRTWQPAQLARAR